MRFVSTNSVLALAARDLACYCLALWPKFELAAHHRIIVDKLEAVERGDLRRLMIFLPPRHGKSTLATQFFAAWYVGLHPDDSSSLLVTARNSPTTSGARSETS
jgi:hypothetical protein